MPAVESCKACGGRGRNKIEGCVKKQVDEKAWDLLEMCHYTDEGTWPVDGGVLDQTPSYLRAYRYVRYLKAQLEAEILAK